MKTAPPESQRSLLHRVAEALQLDRTLLIALASRVWQTVSGPITIALVISGLSPVEQGTYYTLVSIVGIQAFFELGLLNVLISQAGHSQAIIDLDPDSAEARSRLTELVSGALRWFAGAALLYCVTSICYGWWMYTNSDAAQGWQSLLLVLIPLAAAVMFLSPILAILEGIGLRQYVYSVRLVQMVLGSLVVWLCLGLGFGIWALVLATLVQLLCMLFASRRLRSIQRDPRPVEQANETDTGAIVPSRERDQDEALVVEDALSDQERNPEKESFRWMVDVLPSQWRLAVASAAYHFATQMFPLILMTFHSAIEAGRLGMTMTITTAIQMLALSWVQTKYAVVSRQHGLGQREIAGRTWRRTTVVSALVLILGFCTLALLIPALGWIREDIPSRFINPVNVLWLGIGALGFHGVALQSFYVLSRGGRPFLIPSLLGSSAVAAGVWFFGYNYSVTGIVIAYAAMTLIVALPIHTLAYMEYRRDD